MYMSPLDLVKAKYLTFLSVPKKYRPDGLKTTRDFADHFGIPAGMLMQWEQQPGFITDVFMQSRAIIARNMAEIIEALVDRAKTGSVAAIKLALEVGGVHHDTVEVQHTKSQDQIILVLPPGMEIPNLPQIGDGNSNTIEGEIVGPQHIDSDMDFILGVSGKEEVTTGANKTPTTFDVDDDSWDSK
jgi:hypothetical protein